MKTLLRFDFAETGTVKTHAELKGRGITFLCTQLDGSLVYSLTDAAKRRLEASMPSIYTNDNGQEIAA